MHIAEDVRNKLVLRDLLLVDRLVEHDDEGPAGREDVVRQVLRVAQRDGVVGDLDGLGGDRLDRALDLGRRERAVDDVRRADGLQVRLVVLRGGGDDGREAGELSELDGWARKMSAPFANVG